MTIMTTELIEHVERLAPDGPPLRRLSLAVLAAADVARAGDAAVAHYVEQCRRDQLSWAEIGAALGVSKQAAQQRHATGPAPHIDELDALVGLDDDARAALRRARDEARILAHHYTGTEHVVVGVLRLCPDLAARLGCSADDALVTLLAMVDRGVEEPARPPLLTARARKTIDLAAVVATETGHPSTTPADLLLGVIRERRGVGARILDQRAGGLDVARHALEASD